MDAAMDAKGTHSAKAAHSIPLAAASCSKPGPRHDAIKGPQGRVRAVTSTNPVARGRGHDATCRLPPARAPRRSRRPRHSVPNGPPPATWWWARGAQARPNAQGRRRRGRGTGILWIFDASSAPDIAPPPLRAPTIDAAAANALASPRLEAPRGAARWVAMGQGEKGRCGGEGLSQVPSRPPCRSFQEDHRGQQEQKERRSRLDPSREEDFPRSDRCLGWFAREILPDGRDLRPRNAGTSGECIDSCGGGHVPVQRRLVERPGPPIRRSARISLRKGVSRGRGRGSSWGVNERRVPLVNPIQVFNSYLTLRGRSGAREGQQHQQPPPFSDPFPTQGQQSAAAASYFSIHTHTE